RRGRRLMPAVLCPACRESNSEFDSRCAACGAALPLHSIPSPVVSSRAPRDRASGEDAAPGVEVDPLSGRQVSHFRIVGPLGRGGMGIVYRALDLDLGREVALKFLAPDVARTASEVERFRREAQATAALDHPGIGIVHEIGEHEGRRFLALALYDGETLAARIAREPERRLPVAEAVAISGQLASALAAAHAAGVVHRDVKPENVMLLRDGRVKLLDFGLASWAESPRLTEQGIAVGTAAYMPPEAFRGEESGPAGDLWALGVLLYEMLAGRRPFGGERRGMVHNILHEEPVPLREIRPDLPLALAPVVARCLAKAPGDRPADAREILSALAAAGLWDSGSSGGTDDLAALRRPARTGLRKGLLAAAIAGTVLAAGIATYLWTRPPEPPVYVAVLEPKVTGSEPAADLASTAANLQTAILRALAALDGVAAIETSQVRAVSGATPEIARAVAAGEVIRAEAACAADSCRVRLSRLSGADGRVLWTAALQLPPSRPSLFAEAVAASIRQGYPEHELRFESAGLAAGEADYRSFLALRQRMVAGEDLDEILAALGELRRRAPELIEIYFLEASVDRRRFSESGDRKYLDAGLRVAEAARQLAPQDPRPLATLFELELQAGRLDEAQALLDRLAAVDPAGALLRRGQLAERRGQDDQAIELMTAAVGMQPSWHSLLVLANAEYRLGRLEPARRHLGELLARSPGNVEGLRTLAQIELLDDPRRAAELLGQLVAKRPDAGALSNLGLAFLLLRRYPEAETNFRRALALQPKDPSAALNLADCLTLLGRDREARDLYRGILAAAAREPTLGNWPMLSVEAQARAHLGEKEKAIEAIQQALRLTPDNAQLAFEAAVVYVVIGDRASALFHARKAAAHGLDPRWFAFSWFDPLRADPAFAALAPRR
ncbi:MAG TPA: protein kinase, partial [Thermoanaerobaculia bacterium]|nr:protein kinase [Thermoanaerobaculia bacterium]